MKRSCRIPKYRLHKPSDQAVVTLNGRDVYLGPHGTQASKDVYDRAVHEWLAHGRQTPGDSAQDLTIAEMVLAYWEHVQGYYVRDDKPSPEQACIQAALRPVLKLYANVLAHEFGPIALRSCRNGMVEAGLSRYSVNKNVGRIKRMFRWATEHELVPGSTYHALLAVEGLKRGRTTAKESPGRGPANEEHVAAVLPHLSAQVAAMINLQMYTGMRPGEVVQMRGRDIDCSGTVWVYTVPHHKTAHYGYKRRVAIGPKAQEVLKAFLERDPDAYLFDPRDAEQARNARRKLARKSKRQPSQLRRKRKVNPKRAPKDHYTRDSYRRAVQRGCDKAEVPRWHPHQLRHNAATFLEREIGIEATRVVLGHRSVAVTEVYVERDLGRAIEAMGRLG